MPYRADDPIHLKTKPAFIWPQHVQLCFPLFLKRLYWVNQAAFGAGGAPASGAAFPDGAALCPALYLFVASVYK